MSRKAEKLIIVGSNLKKGLMCIRGREGYELWIVQLNKDFKTGERFKLSDIDKVQYVIHFTDWLAVRNTINALTSLINPKREIEEETFFDFREL